MFDEGLSSVTTKVKGIAHTNLSLHSPVIYKNTSKAEVFNQGLQTWDAADYVTPPEVRFSYMNETIHSSIRALCICSLHI